jgi:hypothetical protein
LTRMPALTTTARRTIALPLRPQTRREARLLPEHAHRYPGVVPGQWEPAATLADRVLAYRVLRGGELLHPGRILLEAHFEFRGGEAREGIAAQDRPRREDR